MMGYRLQGRVEQKFAPRQDATNFYVRMNDVASPVWFAAAHFSKFEPLDVIGVESYRESDKGLWVRPRDTVVVIQPATVPRQEVTLELGYVSNPRNVFEGQYWYMFKLARWHRCYYGVAAKYWLGDSDSQDGLLAADYYTLLGVDRDASFPTVRAAWKQMIVTHHPDRFVLGHSQEVRDYQGRLAARINAARDCLIDVGERERYDQQRLPDCSSPRQAAIRAWPGRGFGTLRARVEDRGSVVLVKEILSWEPQRHVFTGTVPLREIRVWGDTVQLGIPILKGLMQVGQETLRIAKHLLSPALVRAIERRAPGEIEYRFEGIRTGGYSMKKQGVYTWIRVQQADVKWTPA